MTQEEFVSYHREKHAPLFCLLPAVKRYVRRYVQQHTLPVEMPGLPPAKYDGITELWFDDADGIGAVFTDSDYHLHGCDFIVSQENVVM